jgi:hypothetical protein
MSTEAEDSVGKSYQAMNGEGIDDCTVFVVLICRVCTCKKLLGQGHTKETGNCNAATISEKNH